MVLYCWIQFAIGCKFCTSLMLWIAQNSQAYKLTLPLPKPTKLRALAAFLPRKVDALGRIRKDMFRWLTRPSHNYCTFKRWNLFLRMRHCTTFGVPRLIFFPFVFDLFWPQYNWNFNLWTLGHDIYDPEYKEINGVVESTSSMFVNFNIVQLTSVLMPYKFTVPLLLLLPHSICRHAHPL